MAARRCHRRDPPSPLTEGHTDCESSSAAAFVRWLLVDATVATHRRRSRRLPEGHPLASTVCPSSPGQCNEPRPQVARSGIVSHVRRFAMALLIALGGGPACTHVLRPYANTSPPGPTETVRLTWLGTAGIAIDDGKSMVLLDPFVSRAPLRRVLSRRPVEVDHQAVARWWERLAPGGREHVAVVVTHAHYDHSMDAPAFAQISGGQLYGSAVLVAQAHAGGFDPGRIHEVTGSDAIEVGGFRFTIFDSEHGGRRVFFPGEHPENFSIPAAARDYKPGPVLTVLVEHGSRRVLHHASAGWAPGMYDGVGPVDLVLLGAAGHADNQTDRYLAAVPLAVEARHVAPIHYDNFFGRLDPRPAALPGVKLRRLVHALEDHALSVVSLPLGETRALP
ncbi:MAG: MBL fold metallo-hydrolase [Deltaproteobacteria bacterium]|nr:MBL fold metallo-hydrolase [Deltaproteobacteria bacterium]